MSKKWGSYHYFKGCFLNISQNPKYPISEKFITENFLLVVNTSPIEFLGYLGNKKWELYQKLGARKIYEKDFSYSDLRGLDLSLVQFDGVNIVGANISYTHANIDPQKIKDRNMQDCGAIGLNLMDKDFNNVNLDGAYLSYSGAFIPTSSYENLEIWRYTNLEGCFVLCKSRSFGALRVSVNPIIFLKYLGNAKWPFYEYLCKNARDRLEDCLFEKDFRCMRIENIDLSDVDFTEILLDKFTSLKNTHAHITKGQAHKLYPEETEKGYAFLEDLGIHLVEEVPKLVKK